MRLGFPVKILGQGLLKSHDSRRWQNEPHLSVSLAYLRDIFLYLNRQDIHMYRLSSDLAPYVSHPTLTRFHGQVGECQRELAQLGDMAREYDVRLSFHLPLTGVLNALDEDVVRQAARQAQAHAEILDGMGLGPEAVIVSHVGGIYGDRDEALARFVQRYQALAPLVRRRLALENDDSRFSVPEILSVHEQTGIPLVFDLLHFLNHNPQRISSMEALEMCLRTWPPGVTPKVHFSSPRTAMRVVDRKGRGEPILRAPRPDQHADFIDPFQFLSFVKDVAARGGRDFDVMLEAKAKDLALLHLRDQLGRLAPGLAVR
ncbi:MAG TPA: UV DNA damage repair endonuclease UvsE [Chloroflexi bacterium]|nr:UV DNA damage repair endonuclease UvsE [Chloroflexota bacterium]